MERFSWTTTLATETESGALLELLASMDRGRATGPRGVDDKKGSNNSGGKDDGVGQRQGRRRVVEDDVGVHFERSNKRPQPRRGQQLGRIRRHWSRGDQT